MPKQTFFNLPDDKRNQILDVVLDEFAENDYDNVSISRIVARAGIAKGSFYQYFDGKEDLYHYLIDLLAEEKARAFSLDQPDPQHVGVFNYLRWILESSVEFELSHPRLSRIGYRLLNGGPSENRIIEDAIEGALAYYRNLVLLGQEQGDIAPDIDADLAASVFNLVMSEMGRKILNQVIADHGVDWHGRQGIFDFPEARAMYEQVLRILEFGMSSQSNFTPEGK